MKLSERIAALEAANDESIAHHMRVILRQVEKIESRYGADPRFRAPAEQRREPSAAV